jgi:hypothetical protein
MTKEQYKKALEDGRIYLKASNDRGTYRHMWEQPTDPAQRLTEITGLGGYWSKKKQCYWVTAIGTSRPLEVILSVGYTLGLSFHEIMQRYTIL